MIDHLTFFATVRSGNVFYFEGANPYAGQNFTALGDPGQINGDIYLSAQKPDGGTTTLRQSRCSTYTFCIVS